MTRRVAPSHAERGQTLPIWTFSVLTALTLMFFSLNYANVIRWQVRAQNAADAAATAALTVQATEWNKITSILYASDVEEWRMRHLMQGMIDASNGNGGCNKSGGSCLAIYTALRTQYIKAVNRYTTEVQMLQSLAPNGQTSQSADATKIVQDLKASCTSSLPVADCSFSYHIINYSYRVTTEQAGKDAFYYQLGGFTSPQDTTPVVDWEPAQIEISTCATVQPIVTFSVFGLAPQATRVIGRAAATNVTETAEWFVPGVIQNPANNNADFQVAENYDTTDDTFAGSASPRDWYETNYPAINYTAYPSVNNYNGIVTEDFGIMAVWWSAIPELPFTTAGQSADGLCTQT
jgi:hypothetical protein